MERTTKKPKRGLKPQFMDAYNNPIWVKYQCGKGARWTAVKNGGMETDIKEKCYFSGCKEGTHNVKICGETSDRNEASDWFYSPYK